MKRMLIMVVALFFVAALAGAALAQGRDYPLNYDFKGQVMSVDVLSKKLTAESNDPLMGASTFNMDDITRVTMCGQLKSVQDIKVGEKVTVKYHEDNGELHADAIDLPAPLVSCLLPLNEEGAM